MKHMLFIFASLLGLSCFAQPVISWGPEVTVADGTTYGNVRPRLTVVNDLPVVLFGKSGNGDLYIVKGNGTDFNTPQTILPMNMGSYLANWTGPDIASKGDTVIAVFKAMPHDTGKVYSVRSTDGGVTFSDTIRVDNHDTGMAWMPSMSITDEGNPVVTYMAHDGASSNPRYVYAASTDAGVTYLGEQEIASSVNGEACDCCPAEMVVNNQQQALLFRNNESNIRDIHAVYSNDGGANFTTSDDVDEMNWEFQSCPSTGPDGLFLNGDLITTYASRPTNYYRVFVTQSTTNSGITFSQRFNMVPPTGPYGKQNFPRIAGEGDVMAVVWTEAETSNYEIFYALTTSGSLTELTSYKYQINEVTNGTQTNPDIFYDNGNFHLVYTDLFSGNIIYRKGVLSQVGVGEKVEDKAVLFPNPVLEGNQVTIFGDFSSSEVQCVSIEGKEIELDVIQLNDRIEITVSDALANGHYIVTIDGNQYDLIIQK